MRTLKNLTEREKKTILRWMGGDKRITSLDQAVEKIEKYYTLDEFFWTVDQAYNNEECEAYRRMYSDSLARLCYEL